MLTGQTPEKCTIAEDLAKQMKASKPNPIINNMSFSENQALNGHHQRNGGELNSYAIQRATNQISNINHQLFQTHGKQHATDRYISPTRRSQPEHGKHDRLLTKPITDDRATQVDIDHFQSLQSIQDCALSSLPSQMSRN